MDVRLTDADEAREPVVDIRPHERLTITLDQPGGTGYLWELEDNPTRYRVVDQKIQADESEDTFGGSGTQVFVVEPLVEGTTQLVFRLAAPWSSEAAREQRLVVRSTAEAEM
jgi:predicted secreted protein